ncbi:hypothetical protein QL093DRAFT_1103950 [Fusarium oxysporum]|nr:hypothetical protein QL093DRAFT_1103950 [Fusarium oxysporum]
MTAVVMKRLPYTARLLSLNTTIFPRIRYERFARAENFGRQNGRGTSSHVFPMAARRDESHGVQAFHIVTQHLHEFFDAQLFSIHPHTPRIRVFVPYDALTEFKGKRASVQTTID